MRGSELSISPAVRGPRPWGGTCLPHSWELGLPTVLHARGGEGFAKPVIIKEIEIIIKITSKEGAEGVIGTVSMKDIYSTIIKKYCFE